MIWFAVAVGQNPIFFYMFYDFYRQAYNKKQRLAASHQQQQQAATLTTAALESKKDS